MHNLALTIASPLETTYFSFFAYNPAAQRGGGQCLTALNIFYDGAYAFFSLCEVATETKEARLI